MIDLTDANFAHAVLHSELPVLVDFARIGAPLPGDGPDHRRIIHRQRQATPSDQEAIIRRPVFHPADGFFLDRGTGFRYVAHRRIWGKRRRYFLPETTNPI